MDQSLDVKSGSKVIIQTNLWFIPFRGGIVRGIFGSTHYHNTARESACGSESHPVSGGRERNNCAETRLFPTPKVFSENKLGDKKASLIHKIAIKHTFFRPYLLPHVTNYSCNNLEADA